MSLQAAFVPSPDNAHDTSYFTSRHTWNSSENRVFADPGYESSDYETSASGRSTSSSETRPEEPVRDTLTLSMYVKRRLNMVEAARFDVFECGVLCSSVVTHLCDSLPLPTLPVLWEVLAYMFVSIGAS